MAYLFIRLEITVFHRLFDGNIQVLLGASVWNTQKMPDRTTLNVIIYDQLIDAQSAMDFNDEALVICEGGPKWIIFPGTKLM